MSFTVNFNSFFWYLSLFLLQFSTKTAEADTSSELAKKSKETFRKEVSRRGDVIESPLLQSSDYLCVCHRCPSL